MDEMRKPIINHASVPIYGEKMKQQKKWMERIMEYDAAGWRGALVGIVLIALPLLVKLSAGFPTGLGWLHYALFLLLSLLVWCLATILVAWVMTMLRLPIPRLFVSAALIFFGGMAHAWSHLGISIWGAYWVVGLITIVASLFGSSFALLFDRTSSRGFSSLWRGGYCAISFGLAIYGAVWLFGSGPTFYPPGSSSIHGTNVVNAAEVQVIEAMLILNSEAELPNPAEPGPYRVETYSYGSGMDRHRDEFATDVDWISPTVDASDFLTGWREPRSWFWGFDERSLPLNGRVWMPGEAGRFPLVLIVHGSNFMEYFSDEGFQYLGELLASQGFIVVSVDENFINYSTWSGDLDQDMTIRAWILLQHLHAIEQASQTEGNFFTGKVDMDRIALIGHSRGGQAAVLAAEFNSFFRFSDAIPTSSELDYEISAVVAFSPIDRLVDGRRVILRNTNYLVLQGAMDGDVNTFYGANQFRRTHFSSQEGRFKASLYIEGANHGQFNTVWGSADIASPTHLLMNRADMLSGEEQRQIAKVYVSAFLQATLYGQDQFIPMFKDHRQALDWIPDTTYVSRYEDDSFLNLASFQHGDDVTTGDYGIRFEGMNLNTWEIAEVTDRRDRNTGNRATLVAWDGEQEADFSIELGELEGPVESLNETSSVAFSLANAQLDEPEMSEEMEIIIELETEDEVVVHLPLEEAAPLPPVICTQFTKAKWLEEEVRNGSLGEAAEAVFQSYELPLDKIAMLHQGFEPERLQEIRLIFPEDTSGSLYIDDIGLYP